MKLSSGLVEHLQGSEESALKSFPGEMAKIELCTLFKATVRFLLIFLQCRLVVMSANICMLFILFSERLRLPVRISHCCDFFL